MKTVRSIALRLGLVVLTSTAWPVWAGPRILAVGDSLTEGYGVAKDDSYPAQLEKKLRANGYPDAVVINGGISGATSAQGEKTIRFHAKRAKPTLIILALGANDALRGISPETAEKNLENAIRLAKKEGIALVLAGMKVPPNYGIKYGKEFEEIYPRLSVKYDLPLIPFLLEGVAAQKNLNLPDGIHPNGEGYKIVTDTIYTGIKAQLASDEPEPRAADQKPREKLPARPDQNPSVKRP